MKLIPPKLEKAKSRLVIRPACVFFASLLLGMKLEESTTLNPPTMAVNATTIFFDPGFVEKCSVEELVGVLAHETMHAGMLHPWRRGDRNPKKANRAMDYEINGIIEDAGMELPKGRLREVQYDGKCFEEIYRMLPDEPGDGSGNGSGMDTCLDDEGDAASQQQAVAEMKVRVQQAANIAKAQGHLPASLAKLVEDNLKPKVDWRDELRRYFSVVLKTDQSWSRRQKRFQDIYLPALHCPALGRVAVGIDTSGSVYDRAAEFLDEVRSICEECKPSEIVVVQCDAVIQQVDTYEAGDEMTAKISGGGGTDLRHIFTHFDQGEAPTVLVILTDLGTDFPAVAPEYPVIWVSTEKHVPPFGECIYL